MEKPTDTRTDTARLEPFAEVLRVFQTFCGSDLTATLGRIEEAVRGVSVERLQDALQPFGASAGALEAAAELKRIVGQINVVIHALGILVCLPKILEPGEVISYVSLGAGNTGRPFDLETDRRVAEFKFIYWQGGSETIRQNSLFKDFFLLAEHPTDKRKFLYVVGTEHPLKFLNGGRSLESVLSRNVRLHRLFKPPITFDEIARDALAYSKAHKRSHSDDEQRMKRVLRWFHGRAADSITPQEIERHFEDHIRDDKWAPSTVNHHRSLLSLTYQLGIRNRKVATNPARATKHRKEDNSRVRYLTTEEEAKLREVVEGKWPQHLLELDVALHTGLRRSEMYGLDWQDVDLARRFVRVKRGKNGDCRYVRLNSVALKALTRLQDGADEAGPVFRGRSGAALKGARHWFEDAVKDAGIEDFHWHDLRHTFASRLAMAGAGIRAIQEALGHKSITMTVRYSHLSPDFIQDAVDRLAPPQEEESAENRTDTTTDTSELEAMETGSKSVH